MILELDLGNTSAKWRVRGAVPGAAGRFRYDEVERASFAGYAVSAARAVSVAAAEDVARVASAVQRQCGVAVQFVESSAAAAGVCNSYAEPRRMGADRWAAIVAAHHLTAGGAVIIDAGTALKIDLVHGDGHHLGGYIGAGLGMMRDALSSQTQKVRFTADEPANNGISPGDSTAACVGAGTLLALRGSVELGLREAGIRFGDASWEVLLCGGDAAAVQPVVEALCPGRWRLHADLVLDGLIWLAPFADEPGA